MVRRRSWVQLPPTAPKLWGSGATVAHLVSHHFYTASARKNSGAVSDMACKAGRCGFNSHLPHFSNLNGKAERLPVQTPFARGLAGNGKTGLPKGVAVAKPVSVPDKPRPCGYPTPSVLVCSHRLAARIADSQSVDAGSIPAGNASYTLTEWPDLTRWSNRPF